MRYSASIAAVNASFLRMSATRKAFRNVRSTASGLEQLAGPARGLDLLARGLREAVAVHGSRPGALLSAPGRLPVAGAFAATDALRILPRARDGLEGMQPDALVRHRAPPPGVARSGSTHARWARPRARWYGRSCRVRACAGSPAGGGFPR